MQQLSSSVSPVMPVTGDRLQKELIVQSEKCIECKLCRKECTFLQKYGSPKRIADTYDPASLKDQMMPFECSLCQLCAAVCPVKINPAAMFLEMRRETVTLGAQDLSEYGVILNYEKRGTSRRYSYYALPENCDTVLFPGCTLSGTRPDKVKGLHDHLQKTIPHLGIVLDCCTKPSHDLGREKHFHAMFSEMMEYLLQHGVKNILVACPNCYKIFKQYGGTLQVKTVYEHLTATSLPATAKISGTVTVHDPCGTRNEEQIHAAVRRLAAEKSLTLQEMKHHGLKTLCCGEGGSVGCVNPDYAKGWGARRKEEAGGVRILTYCAGCAHFLGSLNPTSHILDVLFEPEATLAGKVKISKAPWTYLNRLLLKSHFKKKINAAFSRERAFTGEEQAKGGMLKRIVILLFPFNLLNNMQSFTTTVTATYNFKKSLIIKAVIIAVLVFFALTIVYIIRRYFYILDAYVYTGEFHLLFIKNNLHAAKLEHVTEYFKPMSFFMALPIFMAGTCYVGLDPSSSEHVLMQAAIHAFGGPVSFLFGVLGFFFLGLLSFGMGSLILGDIVPLLMKERYAGYQVRLKKPALFFFPLMFALPFVPVILTAVTGSISRVPLTRILQCMLVGFIIRTLIEMLI